MPLLRRRRRDREQPVAFRVAKPLLRKRIRDELRRGEVTDEQRSAMEAALADDDLLESAYQVAHDEFPDPNGRDWQGFFAALAEFLQTLLPILLELFKGFGVPV